MVKYGGGGTSHKPRRLGIEALERRELLSIGRGKGGKGEEEKVSGTIFGAKTRRNAETKVPDTFFAPAVQYTYQDGASGSLAAYLRLTDVTYPSGTYPSGQEIEYNYGDDLTSQAAVDAIMSRLSSISDSGSGGTDAVYTYLGLDTLVAESYSDSANPGTPLQVALDYDPAGDKTYSGFDRFGRVQTQLWEQDGDPGTPVDQTAYSPRDADGNVTGEAKRRRNRLVERACDRLYLRFDEPRHRLQPNGRRPVARLGQVLVRLAGQQHRPVDGRHVQRQ